MTLLRSGRWGVGRAGGGGAGAVLRERPGSASASAAAPQPDRSEEVSSRPRACPVEGSPVASPSTMRAPFSATIQAKVRTTVGSSGCRSGRSTAARRPGPLLGAACQQPARHVEHHHGRGHHRRASSVASVPGVTSSCCCSRNSSGVVVGGGQEQLGERPEPGQRCGPEVGQRGAAFEQLVQPARRVTRRPSPVWRALVAAAPPAVRCATGSRCRARRWRSPQHRRAPPW